MANLDDKRVTRIQAAQVALLHQSHSGGTAAPDFESSPQHPLPKPVPAKWYAPFPPSERTGKAMRLISPKPPRQDPIPQEGNIEPGLFVHDGSPWEAFRKYYECDLAGPVAVCVRVSGDRAVRAIRQFPIEDCGRVLQMSRSLHHQNTVPILEVFRSSDIIYTLSDFDPLVLDHIVACKAFPDEQQLAAIMSQLIAGLSYLVARSFHHPSLSCSNVLMNLKGDIKIGCVDACVARDSNVSAPADLAPVSQILMELMQKYAKDDGAVGIDNLDRWRSSPAAIEFLCATTSVGSFEELKEQRLLTEIPSCPGDLIGLAWFALISARTFYSYAPQLVVSH